MRRLPVSTLLLASAVALPHAGCACPPDEHAIDRAAGIATSTPMRYTCHRAADPIVIDGRLDEDDWIAAPWTPQFVDIEGALRPRPRFGTRAKMLWDDEHFYVAALLEEPHVWGTLDTHDQIIYNDNDFEIFIDPDGDTHDYYEIEVNALNTIFDLMLDKPYREGGRANIGWNMEGLESAVDIVGSLNDPSDVDSHWTVEFALPWSALAVHARRPAPPHEGDLWRVNFSRVQWRHVVVDGRYRRAPGSREDNWVWSVQGRINMHIPHRWGYVAFTTRGP